MFPCTYGVPIPTPNPRNQIAATRKESEKSEGQTDDSDSEGLRASESHGFRQYGRNGDSAAEGVPPDLSVSDEDRMASDEELLEVEDLPPGAPGILVGADMWSDKHV